MKKSGFPSNAELERAILQALDNLGGEADVPTINQEVIDILELPEEVVTLEDEYGLGTKLGYRLRWARTNLKSKNMIKNINRGTWALVRAEK